jgi:hypothetical protein
MNERALTFGSHGGLVGVLTEPASSAAPEGSRRAVVFSNVGMHHHMGPHRMYVGLARAIADRGLYALRFDLSGMGDSEQRPGGQSGTQRDVVDLREAMDMLQDRFGVSEFILLGLCSGTDSTHAASVADARVIGAVFLDGYTYSTPGYRMRRLLVRPLQLSRWARWLKRRSRALLQPPGQGSPTDAAVYSREYPSQEQFVSDVRVMTARSTRLLYIFTGTVDYRYNHTKQLFEILGDAAPGDLVSTNYFRHVDHLFSTDGARRLLNERVVQWINGL